MAQESVIRPEQVAEASLRRLREEVQGVLGSVVADPSGLLVAADKGTARPQVLAATAALLRSSSASAFRALGHAEPLALFLEGDEVQAYVTGIPDTSFTLFVLVNRTANLGMLRLAVDEVLKELSSLLSAYS